MPSPELLDLLQADTADDPYLALLTIDHPDLPAEVRPMRFVRDYVDLVSRGHTFQRFPFNFARPGQGESKQPARLVIDNVDQRIVRTLRALSTPPTLLVEFVIASHPDVIEEALPELKLYTVSGDRLAIEAALADAGDDDNEPATRWSYTPSLAPALFA